MKGGIFLYVEPVEVAGARAMLSALDEAGLALSHPTLGGPTYLSGERDHEGEAFLTDIQDLAQRISEAGTDPEGSFSFQLWVDRDASTDVVCSVSAGHAGLTCLEFSFDGLGPAEADVVEDAVANVRRQGPVEPRVSIIDRTGIDPPHVSPLSL